MNIFKQAVFRNLIVACGITNLGDWFDFFAIQIIFLYNFHATPLLIAVLVICYIAPMAFFGLFVGVFVDRFPKFPLMIGGDLICGLLTLGIFFSHVMLLVLVLIFLRGMIASVGNPALMASIRHNVSEDKLLQATSIQTIVFQSSRLFGPLVGAMVVALSSAYMCLLINAVSFFVSAGILFYATQRYAIQDKSIHSNQTHFMPEWHEGIQQILSSKLLIVSVISLLFMLAMVIMVESQLVYILKILEPNQKNVLGYYLAASAGSGVVFGMFFAKYKNIQKPLFYFFIATILLTIGYGLLAIYNQFMPQVFIFIAAGFQGIGLILFSIVFRFVMQKTSPKEKMGRVSGLIAALQGIVMLLGSLLAGILLNGHDLHNILKIITLLLLVFSLLLISFSKKFSLA